MAQKIEITLSCDLCGKPGTQTRTISLDGRAMEVDLCAKDSKAFDKVTAKYLPHARKVRRAPATGRRTTSDRQHSANVREWAKAQGYEVSDRGRIPVSVEEEYQAAH
jgi:hypothetical protein